jgi:16S rRNA (guanine527-N7)-methyltransferase
MFHVKHGSELAGLCRRNGLRITEGQLALLELYVGALLEWNQKVNLISRKDEGNIWAGHILHSLSVLFRMDLPDVASVLDLGSGGGLPGIPLSIVREGWSVTLMDSIQKKCTAVENIVARLGLPGRIRVVCGRAEDRVVLRNLTGKFDFVLARGVAPLADLVRWSRPYLKKPGGGKVAGAGTTRVTVAPPAILAYKGGDLEEEVREMQIKARAEIAASFPLAFDGSDEMGLLEKRLIIVTA